MNSNYVRIIAKGDKAVLDGQNTRDYGIICTFATNTYVMGNNIFDNRGSGLDFFFSNDSVAFNNKIKNNKEYGAIIYNTENLLVSENKVERNSGTGIYLNLRNNILERNGVHENRQDGILLDNVATSNSLILNRLEDNRPYDLEVLNLDNNNFLKNSCCKSNPRQLCRRPHK